LFGNKIFIGDLFFSDEAPNIQRQNFKGQSPKSSCASTNATSCAKTDHREKSEEALTFQ